MMKVVFMLKEENLKREEKMSIQKHLHQSTEQIKLERLKIHKTYL